MRFSSEHTIECVHLSRQAQHVVFLLFRRCLYSVDNLGKTLLDQLCFSLATCDVAQGIDEEKNKNIVIYLTARMQSLKIK